MIHSVSATMRASGRWGSDCPRFQVLSHDILGCLLVEKTNAASGNQMHIPFRKRCTSDTTGTEKLEFMSSRPGLDT